MNTRISAPPTRSNISLASRVFSTMRVLFVALVLCAALGAFCCSALLLFFLLFSCSFALAPRASVRVSIFCLATAVGAHRSACGSLRSSRSAFCCSFCLRATRVPRRAHSLPRSVKWSSELSVERAVCDLYARCNRQRRNSLAVSSLVLFVTNPARGEREQPTPTSSACASVLFLAFSCLF